MKIQRRNKLAKKLYDMESSYVMIPLDYYSYVNVRLEGYQNLQDAFDILADYFEEKGNEWQFVNEDDDDFPEEYIVICGNHCRKLKTMGRIDDISMTQYYRNKFYSKY